LFTRHNSKNQIFTSYVLPVSLVAALEMSLAYIPVLTAEQKNRMNNDEDKFINGVIIEEHSERLRRTRSVTFRLDSTVIDDLQCQADWKEISLNVLVNQALKRYTEWDRYESIIGMMPVPKVMLFFLIDKSILLAEKS
jgi:hypothetical protein